MDEGTAWQHTLYLVDEIGARGSGTAAEEAASDYVQARLKALGIATERQPFHSSSSAWRPFAVGFGLAAASILIAPWFLPWSAWIATILLVISIVINIREALLQDTLLRRVLPQVNSQNVIGRLTPHDSAEQTLVLVAHVDTHRTPYFHRSRRHQARFNTLLAIAEVGVFLNVVLLLALAAGGPSWLWWLTLPTALLQLALSLACFAVDRTPYSPGANDNAAAVGVALAVAEALSEEPLDRTDLWLLFSGCEEVGAYGMREFLRIYGSALSGARFIDLEMVGQGVPAVVVKEGLFRRVNYDPDLIAAAAAAAELTWQEPFYKKAHAYGESVVTQRGGYPSVTLNTVLPETGKTAVWHRLDDDLSAISPQTLNHVLPWVLALLRALDSGQNDDPSM